MSAEPREDPDITNALPALRRAARQARKLARQTGTEIVVIRNGKLVREVPTEDEPPQTQPTDFAE